MNTKAKKRGSPWGGGGGFARLQRKATGKYLARYLTHNRGVFIRENPSRAAQADAPIKSTTRKNYTPTPPHHQKILNKSKARTGGPARFVFFVVTCSAPAPPYPKSAP